MHSVMAGSNALSFHADESLVGKVRARDMELYRGTAVLMALDETLRELVTEELMLGDDAEKIYHAAAEVTLESLRSDPPIFDFADFLLHGNISWYRKNRSEWTFVLEDASLKQSSETRKPGQPGATWNLENVYIFSRPPDSRGR
eukprot:Selendium_serpulae@DN5952_c0_g1_i2.p2